MGTFAKQPDERLIEFLQQELDDELRSVCQSDADDCEPLFVRDDLTRSYPALAIPDQWERVAAQIEDHPIDSLVPGSTGETQCLVGLIGNVWILILYRDETEGIVVSVDQSVDSSLTAFIEDCLSILG